MNASCTDKMDIRQEVQMLKEKALTLTAPHPISHEAVKAASFARKIEPTTTEDVFNKLAALYLLNKPSSSLNTNLGYLPIGQSNALKRDTNVMQNVCKKKNHLRSSTRKWFIFK
jgi:hypothetical protein